MSKRLPARPKRRAPKSPGATSKAARPARGGSRGSGGEATHICLPAECTLGNVHELKSKLAALLKAEPPLFVDVSGVQRVDTASLQLLAAFVRDRQASRLAVDLRGESAAFAEGVRLLGLRRSFERVPADPPL